MKKSMATCLSTSLFLGSKVPRFLRRAIPRDLRSSKCYSLQPPNFGASLNLNRYRLGQLSQIRIFTEWFLLGDADTSMEFLQANFTAFFLRKKTNPASGKWANAARQNACLNNLFLPRHHRISQSRMAPE